MAEGFSGKVLLDMAISLDGFVAGPNNDSGALYAWYFQPPQNENDRNPAVVADLIKTTGAIIMGRRAYQTGVDFGGYADNPYQCRHVVLTHNPPAEPPQVETDFAFVTDGVHSALRLAQSAARDRHVVVAGGAETAQQFLRAGLIEEIHLHLVPVLLGGGLRLFDHLGAAPVELEMTGLIEAPGVTHLYYRLVK
jgi:dihydrofolate reductase